MQRAEGTVSRFVSFSTMPLPRLEVIKASCRRGGRLLFKGLDMDVTAGRMLWVRGQNGRGKTSLLRLLAGLSTPDEGQVLYGGEPVSTSSVYAQQLVYVGHANALKHDLSVAQALAFLLKIHGRRHSPDVLRGAIEKLELRCRPEAAVRTLSQGQRRRVALARLAVEESASVWVLDEPFDSLDADGAECVARLLVDHLARGGRVVLTSHREATLNGVPLRMEELHLDALH